MRTMISIETISLCESFAKVFALIPTVLAKTVFFIHLSISNLNSLLYDTSMRFLPTQFPFLPVIRDISDIFFFYLIIKVRVVKKKICICKHFSFFVSISFSLMHVFIFAHTSLHRAVSSVNAGLIIQERLHLRIAVDQFK